MYYVYVYVCLYVYHHHVHEIGHQPGTRSPILFVVAVESENESSLSLFGPENSFSRDGFGCHVPRQPAYSPHPG